MYPRKRGTYISLFELFLLQTRHDFFLSIIFDGDESISACSVWLTVIDDYRGLPVWILFYHHFRQEIDFCHWYPPLRSGPIISRSTTKSRWDYPQDVQLLLHFSHFHGNEEKEGRWFAFSKYLNILKKMIKEKSRATVADALPWKSLFQRKITED